ncbi:hypothetical protein AB0L59_12705 [Streptomyces sp. NPDC052109]|uniref:hypothetical protein n=1 Tax=Streptomyces sp. NPDC052109 TaxID=3155527 RepID=UPI00342EDBF3
MRSPKRLTVRCAQGSGSGRAEAEPQGDAATGDGEGLVRDREDPLGVLRELGSRVREFGVP